LDEYVPVVDSGWPHHGVLRCRAGQSSAGRGPPSAWTGRSWGFGNFSSRGENDMILRNVNTGVVEVYDLNNNQITGAAFMGTVGLNWQFSGIGNVSGLGESDMLLRNSNTGGLEVYDISNNQITNAAFIGTVGLDWQFSGVGFFFEEDL
jgi:hypothetical protein